MRRINRIIQTALHNPRNALGLARHRIASYVGKYFSPLLQYRTFLPEAVNIYPTDRCNLNCAMCFEKLRNPRPELDINDWLRIIDNLACFKPRIHLSGGEPFLYRGIDRMIKHIKSHGLFLAITTNGVFLEQYVKTVIDNGVNAVTVSIDGPRDVHDRIRGVAGTFDQIMRGLRSLKENRIRAGAPSLRINSMINAAEPTAMQEVIRIAVTYNAESVQFIHPMFASSQDLAAHRHYLMNTLDRDLNYWQGAQSAAQRTCDIEKIFTVCQDLRREKSVHVEVFPDFSFSQMTPYYSMDPYFYQSIKGQCHAMWSTATLLPSGEVESCPDYIIGNCHEAALGQIWNNPAICMLRKRIHAKMFFTVCRACCFFYL